MKKYKKLYIDARNRMKILEDCAEKDNNYEALNMCRKCLWALHDARVEIYNNEHSR